MGINDTTSPDSPVKSVIIRERANNQTPEETKLTVKESINIPICFPLTPKEMEQAMNSYQPTPKISIVDWFDVRNTSHLIAYKRLQDSGTWPENFIPADIVFPTLWSIMLASKIADYYVAIAIEKNADN